MKSRFFMLYTTGKMYYNITTCSSSSMLSLAHSENSHKTSGGHASGAAREGTPAVLEGK